MMDLEKLKALGQQAAAASKEGEESQQILMEKANAVQTFEHQGFKLQLRKLPLPVALRIQAKLPSKVLAEPGTTTHDVELSPEETVAYIEAMTEALEAASAEGITKEQFGRMTPPEFPSDFLGEAFAFLVRQNQMTKKQLDSMGFFRGKP